MSIHWHRWQSQQKDLLMLIQNFYLRHCNTDIGRTEDKLHHALQRYNWITGNVNIG